VRIKPLAGEKDRAGGLVEVIEPSPGAGDLAKLLGIGRDEHGFFRELEYNSDPTGTERGGIFVAGVCQGPKDIPDSVAQAAAAVGSFCDQTLTTDWDRRSLSGPSVNRPT
jgi:heterodisulfide reductase subunit A